MKIRNYLDYIVSNKIWQILRIFVQIPGEYTGRHIATLARLNHRTCTQYLDHLAECGVLRRKSVGRANMYTMKDTYYTRQVLIPLIRQEQAIYNVVKDRLIKHFSAYVKAIIIFGSYARNEEDDHSDLDVCLIIENTTDLTKQLDECQKELDKDFELSFAPYVVYKTELKDKKKLDLIKDIRSQGDWIYGEKTEVKELW